MTDLHPYDDVERRFLHTDADPSAGRALVARVLGTDTTERKGPPGRSATGTRNTRERSSRAALRDCAAPLDAMYDLSFYSGGIGVFDRLAISIAADADLWEVAKQHLRLRTPEEALGDLAWGSQFDEWLCSDPVSFLNGERRPFQDECSGNSAIYFQHMSDVNSWIAVWGIIPGRLNYLGFQQG